MTKPSKPFIVKGENAFPALAGWLKERGCNSFSFSDRRYIGVGYDSKPDSDWGKYDRRGTIIVCTPELFDPTCEAIKAAFVRNQAFGWTS